jgi:hypothetical protein
MAVDADGVEIPPEGTAEYWTYMGRGRENPTLGMTEDEKYRYYYPESLSEIDHTGDSNYVQPGEAGYNKPDYDWTKTQSPTQLAGQGYSLTPSQLASLSPSQQVEYLNTSQGTEGYDPRFPGMGVSMGSEANVKHPGPNWLTRLAIGALHAGVAAGLGQVAGAGFGSLSGGASTGVGGASASVPGLTGLPLGGWEQALFPSTFVPPSALEASLFPLSTAGAGSGAGLGALGVGANAGDLLNIATQSTIPKVDYITWENAERLRKGLGQVNQATAQPQQSGGSETPYVPYDTNAPVNFNEDTGVRFAAGGSIGGGLGSLTAMNEGGYLDGPGDGMSDSIPATIEGEQPAALADGEFVVPADCVSHIGNGSTKAGAKRLYSMMDNLRKARTGTTQQGRQINPDNFLPA